jgi:hypothetical protein
MSRTLLKGLSVGLLLLPWNAASALACVCYESEGLAADFREASAVFAGRVVALEIVTRKIDGRAEEETVATLEVLRRWKGSSDSKLRVRTCGTQTMICTCGTHFELGAYFVVFAQGEPLETGSCQRTRSYTPVPHEPEYEWLGAEDLVQQLDALVGT